MDIEDVQRQVIDRVEKLFVKKRHDNKRLKTIDPCLQDYHQCLLPWSVIAAVILQTPDKKFHVISIGTGTSCLPGTLIENDIENVVHDGHAEVMARRGLIAFIWDEINRKNQIKEYMSKILKDNVKNNHPPYKLVDGITWIMYISQAPCGDASIHDDDIKDYRIESKNFCNNQLLGHFDFSKKGIVRRKPSRIDAIPTWSMSCSDKLALWSAIGLQGAALSTFIDDRILINDYIIGKYRYNDMAIHRALERVTIRPISIHLAPSINCIQISAKPGIKPSPISTCSWMKCDISNNYSYHTCYITRGWKHGSNMIQSPISPNQLYHRYPHSISRIDLKKSAVSYQEQKAIILEILKGWHVSIHEMNQYRMNLL